MSERTLPHLSVAAWANARRTTLQVTCQAVDYQHALEVLIGWAEAQRILIPDEAEQAAEVAS